MSGSRIPHGRSRESGDPEHRLEYGSPLSRGRRKALTSGSDTMSLAQTRTRFTGNEQLNKLTATEIVRGNYGR